MGIISTIYYQFDTEEYRNRQLQEGYFSYGKDGFGPVFDNEEDVISYVSTRVNNNFQVDKKYMKRMEDFFERRDKNNCKRIVKEIEKL